MSLYALNTLESQAYMIENHVLVVEILSSQFKDFLLNYEHLSPTEKGRITGRMAAEVVGGALGVGLVKNILNQAKVAKAAATATGYLGSKLASSYQKAKDLSSKVPALLRKAQRSSMREASTYRLGEFSSRHSDEFLAATDQLPGDLRLGVETIKLGDSAKRGEWSKVFSDKVRPSDLLQNSHLEKMFRDDKKIPSNWETKLSKKGEGAVFHEPEILIQMF